MLHFICETALGPLVFSDTAVKLAGIEKVTSCPKIGEITVNADGTGAWAVAGEARRAPSVAIQIVALAIAGPFSPHTSDHRLAP